MKFAEINVQSPLAVAQEIIKRREEHTTTPMHAIKLVYLCHGWMLGLHDRRLISESVEAWRYGPVIPSVYHAYKAFRSSAIDIYIDPDESTLDNEQSDLITDVLEAYSGHTAWALSKITHQEGSPWHTVYQEGRGGGAIIPDKTIRDYYKKERQTKIKTFVCFNS